MPFDHKRINGPDNSFSYRQLIDADKCEKQKEFTGKRSDKRKIVESRKIGKWNLIKVIRNGLINHLFF